MGFRYGLLLVVLASVINFSAARAVNISNTWMLPEEGFPVFYRYFRDRISWYEADAVCQFHHAYLVTADTTSQYDAIRAYLKELDITDNVWIGLSKTSEKPNFTWTDFRPLSGEGHWHEDIPTANKDPMCVAMDPAKDFLWKPLSCGGPDVASFICEMPIPSWALGPKGCLLTELPSLTVLYIPEQSSLELTSDCGLDGTKRIACKGNADREEILKQLTCAVSHEDFEDKEKTTRAPINLSTMPDENTANSKTTRSWIWTSNTIDVDEGVPTRHRRGTEDTLSPVSTKSTPSTIITKAKRTRISESSTATTYDTEVTTNNLNSDSTTESPSLPDKSLERTDIETSTLENMDSTSTEAESSTFGSTTETKISTSGKGTDITGTLHHEHEHLFSIIGNGTMFDIIELNDTTEPDHDPKTHEINSVAPTSEAFKPSKKLIQINDKNSKNTTEKSSKTKPVSKKDIYKNADPKKSLLNQSKQKIENLELNLTQEVEMVPLVHDDSLILNRTFRKGVDVLKTNYDDLIPKDVGINKEVPIFPIIKDSSMRLNRTFRKELPSDDYVDVNEINEPPAIPKSIENNFLDSDSVNINANESVKIVNEHSKETNHTKENVSHNIDTIKKVDTASSQIDPKLDDLNRNITHNSDSDLVEIFNPENVNPTNDEALKRQLLPKSLLNAQDKNVIRSTSPSITDDSTEKEDNLEEQPKPNRQRQLTRPQRRSFYPSFFSRVLG